MATVTNPDGTVSEFKIGQDDEPKVTLVKDANGQPVNYAVKLNKDGTPRKKRGPAKKYSFDRKTISAMVAVPDYTDLVSAYGTPSNAINALIKLWRDKK